MALPLVMDGGPAHASMTAARTATSSIIELPSSDASPNTSPQLSSRAAALLHDVSSTTPSTSDVDAVSSAAPNESSDDSLPLFNGRPIRPVRSMSMKVTAYSPDARSCGASADGITASGYSVYTNGGLLVAADTDLLPLGSLVSVPGYDAGGVVPVLDRGGAIKGRRLDVLFGTHEQARAWGVHDIEVTVWEYADGKPNDFRENHWKKS